MSDLPCPKHTTGGGPCYCDTNTMGQLPPGFEDWVKRPENTGISATEATLLTFSEIKGIYRAGIEHGKQLQLESDMAVVTEIAGSNDAILICLEAEQRAEQKEEN